MAKQYIGARYVVKVYVNSHDEGSAEWEENFNYEPLTLVTYHNGSYLSKKDVPASVGNPANNKNYWVQTGFYNGQIANLEAEIIRLEKLLNTETSNRKNVDTTLTGRITDLSVSLNNEIEARTQGDTTLTNRVNALSSELDSEKTTRQGADANLQTQINEIVAPSGEAPNPAEITNARIGYNGFVYPTLGDAIRTQIGYILRSLVTSARTINLFNVYDLESGTINSSGADTSSDNYYRTVQKVPVTPSTIICNNTPIWVVFYDSNDDFISRTHYSNTNVKIDVPATAATVRFSIEVADFDYEIMVLNSGHMVGDFIPFYDLNLISSIDDQNIENYIDKVIAKTRTTNVLNIDNVENGAIDTHGDDSVNASWVRTIKAVDVSDVSHIVTNHGIYYAFYGADGETIARDNLSANTVLTVPSGAVTVRFTMQLANYELYKDNWVVLAINYVPVYHIPFYDKQLASDVGIKSQFADEIAKYFVTTRGVNLFNEFDTILGGIGSNGVETDVTSIYKTVHPVAVNGGYVTVNRNSWIVSYDSDGNFISRYNADAGVAYTLPTGTTAVRFMFSPENIKRYHDSIMAVNDSSLPNDYEPYEYIRLAPNVNADKKYDVFGRQFLIYQFGGEGNDWCFVRTPANYDPYRKKPYPFVICNHGNGTTMNGSPITANWTKHTMYLDSSNPDFDPDYDMVDTSDPELQYSNAVIEKFLSEGFIVCGAENYADGLYGNENCRRACVDFYNHMREKYNTPDYCYMIGASNGAQTSINAAYLLGARCRAMVLQYPLTCLLNHYEENPSHQAAIRSAYGISDADPSEAELIAKTLTHDSLHTNIIDDKVSGFYPAVSLYYSMSDTQTKAVNNAIPYSELLEASSKIVEKNVVTGGHGSPAHFDPNGFFEFLSTH